VEIAYLHASPAQLLLLVHRVLQLKTDNFLQPILNVDVKMAIIKMVRKEYVQQMIMTKVQLEIKDSACIYF